MKVILPEMNFWQDFFAGYRIGKAKAKAQEDLEIYITVAAFMRDGSSFESRMDRATASFRRKHDEMDISQFILELERQLPQTRGSRFGYRLGYVMNYDDPFEDL